MLAVWHMVEVTIPEHVEDEVVGRLWSVPGSLGSLSRPGDAGGTVCLEAAFATREQARAGVKALRGLLESEGLRPQVRVGELREEPWVERFEASRRVLDLPGGFRVVPRAGAARDGKDLVIPPGRAFGTGEHATTRLCVAAMVRDLQPGRSVLDVGTGSGVLAFVAARLGARPVVGVEIDPEAAAVAAENRAVNELDGQVALIVGGPAALGPGAYDLVVANIRRDVLTELAPTLARLQVPGGRVVLSGLLAGEAGPTTAAWSPLGYRGLRQDTEGEWRALTLLRETG